MKRIFLLMTLLCPLVLRAQSASKDSSAIKETCLNYVQGYYNGDTVRVAKALHPDLIKRIVSKKPPYKLITIGTRTMIDYTRQSKNPPGPNSDEPFKGTIQIFDMDQD